MSSLVDAIDTYYQTIFNNVASASGMVFLNGANVPQPFGGIVDAQDWPLAPVLEGGLFLLILAGTPGEMGTPSQNEYTFHMQWAWEIIGTDLGRGQVGQNRGDRYRASMQVMENLRQAHYPGFTQKLVTTFNTGTGVGSQIPAVTNNPYNIYESVWWGPLRFAPRMDTRNSGVLYGAAAVEVTAYADINSL